MLSMGHILLVLVVVLILFGAGKLPKVMGDLGKGMRNMREELSGDDEKKPAAKKAAPKKSAAKRKAPAKKKPAAKKKK